MNKKPTEHQIIRKEVLQNILILTKELVLKAVRGKSQVTDKDGLIRTKSDVLREPFKAKKTWKNVF